MEKKKLIALVLLLLLAVIWVVNRGVVDGVRVNVLVDTIKMSKSMLMLGSTALGIVIGVLLK